VPVASVEEATAAAASVGYPVALKLLAPDVLHKTEAGAVIVDLTNDVDLRAAFAGLAAKFPAATAPGGRATIVLQPMVTGATELLIGATADPVFGPLVAVGLGGITAEVVRDVRFGIAPITDREADTLLRGLRGYPLLTGYRGRPAADVAAVRDTLLRISALVTSVPEILELDLNPVMVLAASNGCRIVDARMRVGSARWS
jgi:acyl-CoA synthetase (NDP forming)